MTRYLLFGENSWQSAEINLDDVKEEMLEEGVWR
jgi:hypothetical protein